MGGCGGTHSGYHRACPEAEAEAEAGLAAFVVAGNQKGFATDLEVSGAYCAYYPQNCCVPNAPTLAVRVVVKGVAAGCMTSVRSGRAAYADRAGQHPCYDARWVQERHEATPVMENFVGREASFLDEALKLPAAHVPSLLPLPARGGRSFWPCSSTK